MLQCLGAVMVDFADTASDLEQDRLTQSLNNRPKFETESAFDCDDCGAEIPAQRRALGGVTRCIQCQTIFEAKQKLFPRGNLI